MNVAPSFLPLWLLPTLMAVAALVGGVLVALAPRADAAYPRATTAAWGARIALGIAALAGIVMLASATAPLFQGKTTLTIGPRLARIGSFDATLSLHLTPTAAALAAVVLVGALVWAVAFPKDGTPTDMAVAALVSAGALETSLAEGFGALIAGAGGVALGAAIVAGRGSSASGARAAATAFAAPLGATLAAAILSWSLAGKFLDERRFLSDYKARFTVDTTAPGQEVRSQPLDLLPTPGQLTMLSPPGARVFIGVANESQLTPSFPPDAIAPFWGLELPPGVQKIAIDGGAGTIVGGDGHDVALVDAVRVLPGAKLLIRPVGATTSFVDLADQTAKDSPLAGRTIAGLPVVDLAAAFLVLGLLGLAAAVGRSAPRSASGAAIAGLGALTVAAAAAHRLGPVLRDAGGVALITALAAALFAAWCALVATRARTLGALLARLSGTWIALASLGVLFPASAAGISLAGAAVASIAFALGVERLADPLKNGADPTVNAAVRPAVIAGGAAAALGATAIACGAILRGGLAIASSVAVIAAAAAGAFALARAATFMAVVELVPADVPAPIKKKKGKGKALAATDAVDALVAKPADKPSFPLPRRAIAIGAAAALGAATGALWLARGLGVVGSMPIQIGVAVAVVGASATLAWRARSADDDAKRRSAFFEADDLLTRAANPSDHDRGAFASVLFKLAGAIDGALRWPLDRLGGATPDDAPKPAEGAES